MTSQEADKGPTMLESTCASVNASFSHLTHSSGHTTATTTAATTAVAAAATTGDAMGPPLRQPDDKPRVQFSSEEMPTRRASVRKPLAVRLMRRALHEYHEWRSGHQYLGRYSVEKLLEFEDYCEKTSALRVASVLLLTPFPGLVAIILISNIPLNSPLEGIAANGTFYVHSALSFVLMTAALLLFMRETLGWPASWYSHKQMLVISLLTCVCNECLFVAIGYAWTFPVPFRDLLGITPYFIFLTIFHILVLGKSVFLRSQQQLIQYMPLFAVQSSTLFIFQAYAILFEHVSTEGQIVLTVGFPMIKAVIKRLTWRCSTCLPDVATDVSVCVAEIFGSMFLNVCIQNVRSPIVGALIIFIDIMQAILETRMYMNHKFIVDGSRALPTALKIIESALFPGVLRAVDGPSLGFSDLRESSTHTMKGASVRLDQVDAHAKPMSRSRSYSLNKVAVGDPSIDFGSMNSPVPDDTNVDSVPSMSETEIARRTSLVAAIKRQGTLTVDDIAVGHKEHAKLLTQTLQLMFASEVLSLAEYMEAATSCTYALYMIALYPLHNAKYNMAFIGLDSAAFQSSLVIILVYVALEIASLGLLVVMVKHKYGFNVLNQIAFALERYWMSVQGKFVGSLALIFIFSTVHQGMDVTLGFDWEKILNATQPIA